MHRRNSPCLKSSKGLAACWNIFLMFRRSLTICTVSSSLDPKVRERHVPAVLSHHRHLGNSFCVQNLNHHRLPPDKLAPCVFLHLGCIRWNGSVSVSVQQDTEAVPEFSIQTSLLPSAQRLCAGSGSAAQCTDGVGRGKFLWGSKLTLPYAVLTPPEFCQTHQHWLMPK